MHSYFPFLLHRYLPILLHINFPVTLASLLFDEEAAGAQRALRDPVSACQGFGVGEKEKKHPPDPRGATDTKF